MSSFYKEMSARIMASKEYARATEKVFEAYVAKLAHGDYDIDREIIKRLSMAIQFFCRSEDRDHTSEGAILLAMLLDISGVEMQELVAIADNIFSQSGDFPNVTLLKKKFPKIQFQVSIFDETQKYLREELNTVKEIEHALTDYQRTLWEYLTADKDVITSAPTSTGKTDIILRYLLQQVVGSEGAFAAVVVPTRALISELAGKIYELAKSKSPEKRIQICTVPKGGPFQDRTFFVMTQERLFELLQTGDLYFNYLFIDEAHNISDPSRGVLLHLTLQKMLEGSNPQIIISMPSYQYLNAFDSVFETEKFYRKTTDHSPVAKIIMTVGLKGRNMEISRLNSHNSVTIEKEFKGNSLANIVYRLGRGESNIVYRNQTDHCEDTARDIAALILEDKDSQALEEAADYVERFLHRDFTLASCLRKGVAFHYSPLPGVIRTLIEDLVRQGEVDFVVATSTLAEGINLPAKNLFLRNPTQQTPMYEKSTRLENVKLDNITGRAGRMLEHFAGNIFLIDYNKWDYQDYFQDHKDEVDKIPTFFKVLNEDLSGVLAALQGTYDHRKENQYTYYTIANKLIKEFGGDMLSATLEAKALKLNRRGRQQLEDRVKQAYRELKVDAFTLEANPTVGFIQQNQLYMQILQQDDLREWILPHPKSSLLYERLLRICEVLSDTGIFLPSKDHTVNHICLIARRWLVGDPIRNIIDGQMSYEEKTGKPYNCNRSVRNVIKLINTDVRFRLSSALRCYHSLITDILGSRKLALENAKIHSFIEVGGCEDRIINLVNLGFSRETALEINRVLQKGVVIKSISDLRQFYDAKVLDKLHIVTKKEIVRLLL